MPKVPIEEAIEEVARADPAMAAVIAQAGPVRLVRRRMDPFVALARAIVFQQLAGAAARAIWGRVAALFPGGATPDAVLAASEEQLRGAGLSGNKVMSIRDLAAKVADGTVPIGKLGRLGDDEIVERLTVVRGIGRWTAEMFLMFQLARPDVWPVDDYGVRNGWARMHGMKKLPSAKTLTPEGERFRPYRSIAALYCWRAVDMSILPG